MSEVAEFFARYAAAFQAFDAEGIAACYAAPCLFVRDGETAAAENAIAVAASATALLDLHRAWDVQTVEPGGVIVLERAPGHIVARVDWRLGRAGSRIAWEYATTYALVPAGTGWRIALASTHDAPF
ncbi:nuclear transport factor 2 family protein [Rubrivirga sp. IMCC45206]|uniref:nuclear transport factor 2 family protein n=1 Tax=Rubrivirga sp. IMCC45206 TaxID=3391614 RepID=UPI00398FDD2C